MDNMKIRFSCNRLLRKRYWIGLYCESTQCDRLWCRIQSGHWLWMTFQRRIVWKPLVTIKLPRLTK